MAKKLYPEQSVQAIAAAIRAKDGISTLMKIADMPDRISAIETGSGGPDLSSDTVTADTMLNGVTAHNKNGLPITGNIPNKSSSDLISSGATVTVPAGYYSAQSTKAVANGNAAVPASTVTANPTVSVSSGGLITATVSAKKSISPTVTAGYISSGSAGTVTAAGSATSQLTTLAASTYNVSSSNQTISSGKYLTGNQTIRGVTTSGIAASNVKAGVNIRVGDANSSGRLVDITGTFTSDATAAASDIAEGKTAYINGTGVTGTLAFVTYRTGSTTPASSLGNNGDIYLKVVN